jgi:putative DNA primase/helicase
VVKYDHRVRHERWEQFIDEAMCGDKETAVYLQKALGYSLIGLTDYE